MKIPAEEKRDASSRTKAPEAFQQLLRRAATPKSPALPLSALRRPAGSAPAPQRAQAVGRAAPGTPEALRAVRQALHTEAQRLGAARAEALGQGEQRHAQRATELVARELTRELARESAPAAPRPESPALRADGVEVATSGVAAGGGRREAAAAAAPGAADLRAQAAMALIERIEVFVRSQRPAMALSVGGALAATVEVERTGPREVALRIQGHRGPPAEAELAQLRAALEARGLQLRSLHTS